MSDVVEMVIEPRTRPVGSGEVRRLLPFRKRRMVGPFVFADIMGPDEFPPATAMNVDAHRATSQPHSTRAPTRRES